MADAATKASAGQLPPEPVHRSALSQTLSAARQVNKASRTLSAGHAPSCRCTPLRGCTTPWRHDTRSLSQRSGRWGTRWPRHHRSPQNRRGHWMHDRRWCSKPPGRADTSVEPSHLSSTSQAPEAMRHTSVFGRKPFAGHAAPVPVQLSARSQVPAAARQTVLAGKKESEGQVALTPEQVSATSQPPAVGRQVVPIEANPSIGSHRSFRHRPRRRHSRP